MKSKSNYLGMLSLCISLVALVTSITMTVQSKKTLDYVQSQSEHLAELENEELIELELLKSDEPTYIQKEYQRLKKENDEWVLEYNKTHDNKIILNRLSDDFTYQDAIRELEKNSNEALKKPVEIKEEDLKAWIKGVKQAKGE